MGVLERIRGWFRGQAKESVNDFGFGLVPDPGLSNHNFFRQWIGIYQLVDRMARARGGNLVEQPLDDRMVYIARGLMRYNTYAQGFIAALRNHTLGAKGLQHTPTGPSAKILGNWLDRWKSDVDWWSWEREIYERVHIEGECTMRFFPNSNLIDIRPIEPEWIIPANGEVEWTFGFYNEPGDVHDVTALHTLYGEEDEIVDCIEWYHIKSKITMRAVKRGQSDFLPMAQLIDDSFKTWRNFLQSEAVRQSVIYFAKQAEGVTSQDLEAAIARETDYAPPGTGVGRGRHGDPIKLQYGAAVEYVQDGTELFAVPAAQAQGTMTGVNAGLLACARQYHMPLVLISGDMSANNTLDFGDESPFGASITDEQAWYSEHQRKLLWRVIEWAVDEGQLPERLLYDGTKLEVAAQRRPSQNSMDNTTRAKTLYDDGVISARERAVMEGVDYDEQQAARKKEGAAQPGAQPNPLGAVTEAAGDGLVEKEITVTRDGKTFTEKRMVKAKKSGSVSAEELKKKPLADKKHLDKLAEAETDPVVKDAIESAAWNLPAADDDAIAAASHSYNKTFKTDHEARRFLTVASLKSVRDHFAKRGKKEVAEKIQAIIDSFGETKGHTVGEETQLVTVHRGGKTFQQKREKGKTKEKHPLDTSAIPKSMVGKAKAALSEVLLQVNILAAKLQGPALKIAGALTAVIDEPSDLKKFAYNPGGIHGNTVGGNDFVKSNLEDALGIGVSGHVVASIAANVLSRVVTFAKKKLAGEEADVGDGYAELAQMIAAIYAHTFKELELDEDKVPTAEAIEANLRRLLSGGHND